MQKLFILLLLLASIAPAKAQSADTDLEIFEKAIKPGTILTYDVNANQKQYKFIVTLKTVGKEVSFDWSMTEPVNKFGTVTMSAEALANATALKNYFTGGVSALSNETSVWVSQKVFNEVAQNAAANIKINGSGDTTTLMSNTIVEYGFNVNGNVVVVPGFELQGGADPKYTVGVIESGKFPVIYKMDLGWTIVLSDIKTP